MDNQVRAERAAELVRLGIKLGLLDDNGVVTAARDLATNLLHLFRGAGLDPDLTQTRCAGMFAIEEDEDGAPAHMPELQNEDA